MMCGTPSRLAAARYRPPPLKRIVIGRNRVAVPSDHVNPLYIKKIDQNHTVGGSPQAIPSDYDLI